MLAPIRFIALRMIVLAFLVTAPTLAYTAAPAEAKTAEETMAQGKAEAAAQHKNILVAFSASWCGNCKLFDMFLADPKIHPILDKAFVFVDLDTGERANDKRHANIPGGQEVMAALGGKDAGYPFLVMVGPGGNPIADSVRPANLGHGGNIGYPDAPWEIAWFIEMLNKAAPSLSSREKTTIQNWLIAHSSSQH